MKIFTWRQRILVISTTILMVALFVAAGYGIGYMLGNTKAGIFVGVLISYPFTQWALVKRVQRLYKKENPEQS